MKVWHLTWSSVGRHPLAPEEGARRQIVNALGRVAGQDVVLFNVVDDHIHVVLPCDEARKGVLSGALTRAFRALSAVPIAPAFTRPVRDRSHMDWLADIYILRQSWKHGIEGHPATWTGSCFPDLAGARVLPGLSLAIAAALPRWRLRRAYAAVFLPERPLVPADDVRVRTIGAARLAAAAASAVCADPTLRGKGPAEVMARRATATLGATAGIPNSEIAHRDAGDCQAPRLRLPRHEHAPGQHTDQHRGRRRLPPRRPLLPRPRHLGARGRRPPRRRQRSPLHQVPLLRPVPFQQVARRFKGARRSDVEAILESLSALAVSLDAGKGRRWLRARAAA